MGMWLEIGITAAPQPLNKKKSENKEITIRRNIIMPGHSDMLTQSK